MTASEFVKRLADIAPSASELEELGLAPAEAADIRNGYVCPRRANPLSIPETDELASLMKFWDTARVEVGMVRLSGIPVNTENGLQIGLVEDDPLIGSSESGELVVEERATCGHVLWRVACSGERFLDALVAAAAFLESRARGKVDCEGSGEARKAAEHCAGLAGGSQYTAFYMMLLGAE
jgi:hypothetical protein